MRIMEQYLRAPPVIHTSVDISDSNPPRESDHDTAILSASVTEAFQRNRCHRPPLTHSTRHRRSIVLGEGGAL